MMRAFKLYTGPDNASHVLEGTIDEKDRTDVVAIHFQRNASTFIVHEEAPPHCVRHQSVHVVAIPQKGELPRSTPSARMLPKVIGSPGGCFCVARVSL